MRRRAAIIFDVAALRIAIVAGLALVAAERALADEIYKWTDESGQVHYSNRSAATSQSESSVNDTVREPEGGEQGWESVLERQKGGADLSEKAEAAINSLELEKIRKKRDRGHAQEELEATQAAIVRAGPPQSPEVASLRAREATQLTDLRQIDLDLSSIDARIAKLRALKAVDREQRSHR
jgi:uncharacterized protein DUF4124